MPICRRLMAVHRSVLNVQVRGEPVAWPQHLHELLCRWTPQAVVCNLHPLHPIELFGFFSMKALPSGQMPALQALSVALSLGFQPS